MQREKDYLCDITLVAKDGKEFKAHRNVLSAASPLFVKLLQSDMKEKKEGVARFEEISAPILEGVLEFVYTGSVDINDEQNAKDLIIAADYLLLECLKTFSGRFLEQRLTSSNCISTFHFAEKYKCAELVSNSKKFVHDNFASVAKSDEFLNLEAKEVGSWISSDEISVAAEEDVFNIIEKWIEQNKSDRKAKFEELFRHVRLVLVSRDFLLDVVTNELVRDSHCLQDVTKTRNGEWGMGNGEWGMGNGEWGMGNGEWGMGNGEWGMGNGEWGMGNGEWGMGNGEWGMGNGEWGMGNGEWGMGNGEWGMGNGEWGMGNGEWGMGNGEWGMGNGEWGMGNGEWGMGNGEWGMGNGEWGMGNGEWGMGNGEWGMGNGEWGMGNGEWGMGNGEWWSAVITKKISWSQRSTAKR